MRVLPLLPFPLSLVLCPPGGLPQAERARSEEDRAKDRERQDRQTSQGQVQTIPTPISPARNPRTEGMGRRGHGLFSNPLSLSHPWVLVRLDAQPVFPVFPGYIQRSWEERLHPHYLPRAQLASERPPSRPNRTALLLQALRGPSEQCPPLP